VSAVKVNGDESIRAIDPFKRNCIFPDETENIQLFKEYSQANCFFECSLHNAQNTIKDKYKMKQVSNEYFTDTD
jgi:hypothetical protein